ncbi:hypothetical protein BOTBODRAFT_510651 [Botryobasidium botryosum FD-172 SS1]|uniref:F-box domain-containing protein n=1 Tax=Botryobasidium botryosum (strain FD-172 SS1) TaxID=930990 RepID=A0A067N2M4_BOTB1|nr:hypothetical protein BOTBODRAFT_510651 [Botryobasidium botryosum FD-172 SS1]
MSPIYRLHDEIVSHIFELTMEPWPWAWDYVYHQTPLALSQVSVRWRDIAISTPRLWSQVEIFYYSSLAELFLERSKSTPLDFKLTVYLTSQIYHIYDVLDSLFVPHMHRLRKLEVSGVPEPLSTPTPLFPDKHSERIFSNSTPLLRHLYLEQTGIPLTSSLFTGLFTLSLRRMRFESPSTQFFANLQACPLLEELTLDDVSFTLPSGPPYPPFLLPRLRSVDLLGYDNGAIHRAILASLIIPPLAHLTVSITEWDDSNALMVDVLQSLSRIRCLALTYNHGIIHLIGRTSPLDDPFLSLLYRSEAGMQGFNDLIRRAVQIFDLPSLDSLVIGDIPEDYVQAIIVSLAPFVTTIRLDSCPLAFLEAFIAGPNSSDIFPRLAELHIAGVQGLSRDVLIYLVKLRVESGVDASCLRRLKLEDCAGLDGEDLAELENYVELEVLNCS